jgi:simple sugar transport system ATP-binding protein
MRVELRRITKTYGALRANDDVSLTFEPGQIHGLLGENGAGKSTLMKVLSGFIQPDQGEIVLGGKAITVRSPADALRQGIGMLHQDPLDFPPLRVIDNVLLGVPGWRQSRSQATRSFMAIAREYNFTLEPEAFVSELTVGERQQLEIARLLWRGARVIILDEPTTGISAPQKILLFAALHRFAEEGKTIIFVSHKLEDVEALCPQVSVLRQGRLVGQAQAPFTTRELVAMMFAHGIPAVPREPVADGQPVMELRQVVTGDQHLQARFSLAVRQGEVIGLAGLDGSGQQWLLRTAAGLTRASAGHVILAGRDLTQAGYGQFQRAGVTYVPADRMKEGLVPGLTLTEHIALTRASLGALHLDWQAARRATEVKIADFNIRGHPESVVESLSGGNQQRALLALLPDDVRVLLLEHPTRGLDVESAAALWRRLLDRRTDGTAIVFISADLDELREYSDRILVFFNGEVIAEVPAAEADNERLGYLMGGKRV